MLWPLCTKCDKMLQKVTESDKIWQHIKNVTKGGKVWQTLTKSHKLFQQMANCDKMWQNTKRAHQNVSSNGKPEWPD